MPEPTPETWAKIRYDYEHTGRTLVDICFEHGTTPNTVRHRARRWGWTMRRTPIPREGPPAALPRPQSRPATGVDAVAPAEVPPPVPPLPPARAGENQSDGPTLPGRDSAAPGSDPALIVPRLQSAVARVLPAVEATIAKLAGQPMPPREMEQAARALGALMRTLRELNNLLAQRQADTPAAFDDDMPEDIDEFRNELARRIDAFVASREAEIPAQYEAAWKEEAKRA